MRVVVAAALSLWAALAHAQSDGWKAASPTAVAVTGDITIEEDRIVFSNGEVLRLVPVIGRDGVFKAEPPANPMLLDGSHLCTDDVTYVVLAHGVEGLLHMKVFEGPEPPLEAIADGMPQAGTCATYSFRR